MKFIARLALLAGLIVLGSFIVLDDPKGTYSEVYDEARCKLNAEWCQPEVAMMVLPGVSVLFVDSALALREGREVAVMAEEWPFCDDATGDVFVVPKFFETDFASIPGWAQFYVKPSEPSIVGGAIAHDWLYAVGGTPKDEAKKRADAIFRRELKNAGVNIIKRNVMFFAVSAFGGKTFGTEEEMRLRDPRTGKLSTGELPDQVVIDNLGEGCDGFYTKYWQPRQDDHNLGYGLDPRFIYGWIGF